MQIKDNAIIAIKEIMNKSGLNTDLFALSISSDEEKINICFSEDLKDAKKIGSIYVKIDPILENNQNLIIDYVTNGEKKGLIFLEKSNKG